MRWKCQTNKIWLAEDKILLILLIEYNIVLNFHTQCFVCVWRVRVYASDMWGSEKQGKILTLVHRLRLYWLHRLNYSGFEIRYSLCGSRCVPFPQWILVWHIFGVRFEWLMFSVFSISQMCNSFFLIVFSVKELYKIPRSERTYITTHMEDMLCLS